MVIFQFAMLVITRGCLHGNWWKVLVYLAVTQEELAPFATNFLHSLQFQVGDWSHALLVLEDLHLATLRSNEICWGAVLGACKTSSCWTLAVEMLQKMSLGDNGTTALQLVFFGDLFQHVPTAGSFLLPSGKLSHNYGKSTINVWVNQL